MYACLYLATIQTQDMVIDSHVRCIRDDVIGVADVISSAWVAASARGDGSGIMV